MIDLIRTRKPWTKNQIRRRSEAFIKSKQTHGDEAMLTRVNDAALLDLRPITDGEKKYRDTEYLPRAVEGGDLAAQLAVLNEHLLVLIAIQDALRTYARENPHPDQVADESGAMVANPAYQAVEAERAAAYQLLLDTSADNWRWVAQRTAGAEIDAGTSQHAAVVRLLPTTELIKQYVEGEGLGEIDGRHSPENARASILAVLEPQPEAGEEVLYGPPV